jgi:hypothetical protein
LAEPTPCRCLKTPDAVLQDELALLRPEWFSVPQPTTGG